ncbi:hypothetical protein [Sphingopyxis sp. R3-92]|uniref:hypothetical protein n=1 Tax=Sphingopyxis sp. R3-92 TaxID=3158553 RepID=UPI003EE6EEF0
MMKFWPEAATPALPAGAVATGGGAFDWELDLAAGLTPGDAAAALLALASGAAVAPLQSALRACDHGGLAPAVLPLHPPLSLWRARDGWLIVHTATRESWRNFCATFLNGSAYRDVLPDRAWSDAEINRLATIILDTHKVDDAVGTCLTYQVPAAAVPGWHDRDRGAEGRALADRLAWAALWSPHQVKEEGMPDER